MCASAKNFVQVDLWNGVDRLHCAEVTEVFAPRGGHKNCVSGFWESTAIFLMGAVFWEKTGSYHLAFGAFGEDRQPLRERMLYLERRRSFVAGHVVLEKARSHATPFITFREEKRTSNSSPEFWKGTQ